MKAYSLDLRQKIVETYESGGITQRELAEQFHVSLNFIVTLLRRWRHDETLEPKKRGAVMKPLLTPEIMQFLNEQIKRECDLSLAQLVELVREKYNVSVSTKTMSRMLIRENLRYKKMLLRQRARFRKSQKFKKYLALSAKRQLERKTHCFR